ncbi:MAG: hypothetical protein Q8R00_01550 [Candidatus Nanoarchaeia archaeon]|nr:hypothetical protein [Candidatus Nanoarchaeia archaeon]
MEKEDASRNFVVVMLIFAILTSILSAWTILGAINSITLVDESVPLSTGYVSVTVAPNPNHPVNQLPLAEKNKNEDSEKDV